MLETLGLKPEEIAYAGDSGTDITFALAVGMLSIILLGPPGTGGPGAQLPESPAEPRRSWRGRRADWLPPTGAPWLCNKPHENSAEQSGARGRVLFWCGLPTGG